MPTRRPRELRLQTLDVSWYRVDQQPPRQWSWDPYPLPRNRFDPASGQVRVRYAARTARGALRERFHDRKRQLRGGELDLRLVRLTGAVRVLDLRNERTLDRCGLDAEISVGRSIRVWTASRRLADLGRDWFGTDLAGFAYASRTTPQTSTNLAFFSWAPLRATDLGALRAQRGLLTELVADDGFRVDLPGLS